MDAKELSAGTREALCALRQEIVISCRDMRTQVAAAIIEVRQTEDALRRMFLATEGEADEPFIVDG